MEERNQRRVLYRFCECRIIASYVCEWKFVLLKPVFNCLFSKSNVDYGASDTYKDKFINFS